MPSFPYTIPLPVATNSPSTDQPKMTINNNSVNGLINVDHYTFGSSGARDGWHKQVTLPVEATPATLVGQASLYSGTAGQSQLFATSDAGANAYQLTRMIDASYTKFADNVGAGASGWTFLPGGLLLQYGTRSINPDGTVTTIAFPISFTNAPFSITIGLYNSANNSPTPNSAFIKDGTVGNTSFQMTNSSGGTIDNVSWMAIGF